jgi:hypothetical protein
VIPSPLIVAAIGTGIAVGAGDVSIAQAARKILINKINWRFGVDIRLDYTYKFI